MAKRAQIVAYSAMRGYRKVTLEQISAKTGVLVSTCSNIIREAKCRADEPGGNSDIFTSVNLIPKTNCEKGSTSALTVEEKRHLVEVTLSDSEHCGITYESQALAQTGTKNLHFLFFLIFNHVMLRGS